MMGMAEDVSILEFRDHTAAQVVILHFEDVRAFQSSLHVAVTLQVTLQVTPIQAWSSLNRRTLHRC